jgi:hypothetical protein
VAGEKPTMKSVGRRRMKKSRWRAKESAEIQDYEAQPIKAKVGHNKTQLTTNVGLRAYQ